MEGLLWYVLGMIVFPLVVALVLRAIRSRGEKENPDGPDPTAWGPGTARPPLF